VNVKKIKEHFDVIMGQYYTAKFDEKTYLNRFGLVLTLMI